jgi:hypothetical protein
VRRERQRRGKLKEIVLHRKSERKPRKGHTPVPWLQAPD